MNKRFQDKTAVITGAAQGIGRRVAERMAAEGGRLLLVDRSELIHELADELVGVAEVLTLTADLEQFAECQRVMAAALERFGRLDILINNVGGTIWAKPFEHYQEHEIEAEVRRSLFPVLPRRAAANARAGQWRHRKCFLRCHARDPSRALRRGEGWRQRPDRLSGL